MVYEHNNTLTNVVRTNTFPMSALKYCLYTKNPFHLSANGRIRYGRCLRYHEVTQCFDFVSLSTNYHKEQKKSLCRDGVVCGAPKRQQREWPELHLRWMMAARWSVMWRVRPINYSWCYALKSVGGKYHSLHFAIRLVRFNLLKTRPNLLYSKGQHVPRSKHFPPRL
jgi:hypothetical protein